MDLSKIVSDIKAKREFQPVDDEFVEDLLNKELNHNKKIREAIKTKEYKHLARSSAYKQLIKTIRAKLRQVYGVFIDTKPWSKKNEILDELKEILKMHKPASPQSLRLHEQILKTHLSSKERLDNYEQIYKEIFRITGKPQSLIDLGCGFNPFSYPFMHLSKLNYFASDLNKKDCEFIQTYFNAVYAKNREFKGIARAIDLTKVKKDPSLIADLPKSDLTLILKVLDSIERTGRKLSELILDNVPSKFIVVSFPTKTISGKYMTRPERAWLERMCDRRDWKFDKFDIKNEIFYIIQK